MKYDNVPLNEKVAKFGKLLESMAVAEKRRSLWLEIYFNALHDRELAYSMYCSIQAVIGEDATQHAIHGPNVSKYLERMNKSNDQLLRLAELITTVEDSVQEMNVDEIYAKMSGEEPKKARAK